ncbi:MAG: hypothetical protein WC732_03180 [Candidatus Omnitrophota bacterium]
MRYLTGFLIFLFSAGFALAQSTVEYATLSTGMTAAAKAAQQEDQAQGGEQEGPQARVSQEDGFEPQEEASTLTGEALKRIYGDSQGFSATSASLFGQGSGKEQLEPVPLDEAVPALSPSQGHKMIEFEEEKESLPVPAAEGGAAVKLHLKDGHIIEGKIVEASAEQIKVDTEGVGLTYFKEEIENIEYL